MPQFQFDAYRAYEDLKERYVSYLLESFGIESTPLGEQLEENWTAEKGDPFRLFAPLHVEGTFPFRPDQPIEGLEATSRDPASRTYDRPLHPKTVRMLERAGFDFRLYEHQVEAIREASEGQSIVLSAGTGSGKTEAFLVPLIDQLFWAQEQGQDDLAEPGVRSIIIYPLNALVNNQIERLRELLAGQDEITFAYYTSRLKETHRGAERYFNSRGKDLPPPCQIVDRQTLRGLDGGEGRPKGPPHILVTNFSMLEYMLVRPKDRSIFLDEHLFDGEIPRLQSVVLDEAHVYEGAQAAEIHMLLRRAARRFGTRLEALQGFATSATLRQGEDRGTPLLDYAADMFAKEPGEVSAIEGERYLPEVKVEYATNSSGLTPPDELPSPPWIDEGLRTLEYDDEGRANKLVEDGELAEMAVEACVTLGISQRETAEAVRAEIGDVPAQVLYELLASTSELNELREWLFEQDELPGLDAIATKLYGAEEPTDRDRHAAHAVLRLGTLARRSHDEHPFLPSRVHAIVRAPVGIWVDPCVESRDGTELDDSDDWPWGKVYAAPSIGDGDIALPLLTCSNCGEHFLQVWEAEDPEWGERHFVEHHEPDAEPRAIKHDEHGDDSLPEEWGGVSVKVRELDPGERETGGSIDECPTCHKSDVVLRTLHRSPSSALGAIVDGLYPRLGEHPQTTDDDLPGGGRRMMTFSDSRQGAAKVASQVESTHDKGVNRRLLWEHICRQGAIPVRQLVHDLLNPKLLERAPANALGKLNNPAFDDLALLSVFEEFARPPANGRTLETIGLVEVQYPNLPPRPDDLCDAMTAEEWEALLTIVCDDARRRGAVRRPGLSAEGRQYDLDQLKPPFIGDTLSFSSGAYTPPNQHRRDEDEYRTVPLVPDRESDRERSRIFQFAKLLAAELGGGEFDPVRLLRHVWNGLIECAEDYRCRWVRTVEGVEGDGQGVRIDLERLRLVPCPDGPDYIEPTTGRVHFRSIRGISPIPDAPVSLQEMTDEQREEWRQRHSVQRVLDDELLGLYSVEHTAQLEVDELEQEEEAFRQGERNLLASSTTMELGVDLGGLTCVLLTNVPPGPANYWQRAGRAGRRADGSSMVLTLALDRPHDQKVFESPLEFFHDDITPPQVRLDTPPLIVRHVNSFLLSAFFEAIVEPDEAGGPMKAFGTVESFMFASALESGGMRERIHEQLGLAPEATLEEAYYTWLDDLRESHPVVRYLRALVGGTALSNWTSRELLAESRKKLEEAVETAHHDDAVIESQLEAERQKGEPQQDEGYLKALEYQRSALRGEHLIGYLARTDFLPRFGFPLNVVKLNTQYRLPDSYRDDEESEPQAIPDLRMERQLEIALREYAPGSEVIAGKRVHRVQGLERNWYLDEENAVRRRFYLECEKCGNVEDRDAALRRCPVCGHGAIQESSFVEEQQQGGSDTQLHDGARGPDEIDFSLVRPYLKPSGFSVEVGQTPKRADRVGRRTKMPPAEVTLASSKESSRIVDSLQDRLQIEYSQDSTVFVRAEGHKSPRGHGYGFAICQACGFAEPEESWGGAVPDNYQDHRKLRGRRRCEGQSSVWRNAVLGTTLPVHAVKFRLQGELYPDLLDRDEQRAFFATLASCLKQVAAEKLQVDPRTLSALVSTYQPSDDDFALEAVLYEESGSGLLEHICDDALGLLTEVTTMLAEHEDDSAFIRFDSQFLAKYGQFRIDLLRQHFVDQDRRKLLERDGSLDPDRMRLLQHATPQMAGMRVVEDARAIALQAEQLAADAFGQKGLLRSVHARLLDDDSVDVRLLVNELPDPDADDVDQLNLARKLRAAIDDGLEVRQLPEGAADLLKETPWELIERRGGACRIIGGLDVGENHEEDERNEQLKGAFGDNWLASKRAVRARGEAIEDAEQTHEMLWESSDPVGRDKLRPSPDKRVEFIDISAGETFESNAVALDELLAERAGLGQLDAIGPVEAIVYADKYVVREVTAMWMLRRLLEQFDYASNATGFVVSLEAENDKAYENATAKQLLSAQTPKPRITQEESRRLERSIQTTLRNQGLDLSFEKPNTWLPHPRKLLVRFGEAGSLDTLRVRFEKGLDWLEPVSGGTAWTERQMRSEETYIVVEPNPDISSDELRDLGLGAHEELFRCRE